ncbi:hypothetical protein HY439_03130 [Candidatus Microgenomates bacterium]|nr:hypothetical protein [Candidatus Microgenomates bacterium]
MSWTAAQRKYSNSSKGKISRLKYQQSPKGVETRKRYIARRKAKLAGKEQIETITPVEKEEKTSKIETEAISNK